MATFRNESFGAMVEGTLKKSAAALDQAGIPFCLIGSMSAWVRGGPESSHDLDYGIREKDITHAAKALEVAGFTIEIPPEQWLIKAWDGPIGEESSALVDLIYQPSGVPITDEVLERADLMSALAVSMRILNPSDLMIMKLLSLNEAHLVYNSIISTARAIREQIDWARVRKETNRSPYAQAFFTMAEALSICPPAGMEQEPNMLVVNLQKDLRREETFQHNSEAYAERAALKKHLENKL